MWLMPQRKDQHLFMCIIHLRFGHLQYWKQEKDGVVKGDLKEGYFVPAGAMLPLGAAIQSGTVLKYGGYFPAGECMCAIAYLLQTIHRLTSIYDFQVQRSPKDV